MHGDETVRLVRSLLAQGKSHSDIIDEMKVSHWFVAEVSTGRRVPSSERKRNNALMTFHRTERPYRCNACGMRANLNPCVMCVALDAVSDQKTQGPRRRPAAGDEYLSVSLRGRDAERYQVVYQAKVRADRMVDEELSIVPYYGDSAMNMFPNAKYVRWLLANLDNLRPLLELAEKLRNASSVQERWFILREAADLLFEVLATFPLVDVAADLPESALRSEANQMGVDWDKINALLPILVPLIELTDVQPA